MEKVKRKEPENVSVRHWRRCQQGRSGCARWNSTLRTERSLNTGEWRIGSAWGNK